MHEQENDILRPRGKVGWLGRHWIRS
jgi:hypothetical protein